MASTFGFLVVGGGLEAGEEGEATGPRALHWVVAELTGIGSCCRLLSMQSYWEPLIAMPAPGRHTEV